MMRIGMRRVFQQQKLLFSKALTFPDFIAERDFINGFFLLALQVLYSLFFSFFLSLSLFLCNSTALWDFFSFNSLSPTLCLSFPLYLSCSLFSLPYLSLSTSLSLIVSLTLSLYAQFTLSYLNSLWFQISKTLFKTVLSVDWNVRTFKRR